MRKKEKLGAGAGPPLTKPGPRWASPARVAEHINVGSTAMVLKLRKNDPTFPSPSEINQRVLRFDLNEIDDWLNERKKRRTKKRRAESAHIAA